MVGPISADERREKMRRLKVGVALLVGVSAALVGLQGGASLVLIGVFLVVGTLLGGALAWYVFPSAEDYQDADERRSFRR